MGVSTLGFVPVVLPDDDPVLTGFFVALELLALQEPALIQRVRAARYEPGAPVDAARIEEYGAAVAVIRIVRIDPLRALGGQR